MSPLFPVFFQLVWVRSQSSFFKFKWLCSLVEGLDAYTSSRLEGLLWCERLLEIHPVLGRIAELGLMN